jgi:glycosyltransferase involved in cell wall biosynthesis
MKNLAVSIIIPCRNEEKFIEKCLNSVFAFEKLNEIHHEIIVVDGMSNDNTRNILSEIQKKRQIVVLDNPNKIQATALNIGIKYSTGEYILRLDAHSIYPKDYLSKLIETSQIVKADNIGGLFLTMPGNDTYQAHLVQALTTHPFGVGNSGFRLGYKADYADTVPYGFFKKEVFERYGLFDERLVRCQDYEFNRRIINWGGKIWRNPEIKVYYYNQPTVFRFLKKQLLKEGPYNAYMWYLAPYTFAYRHLIPAIFAMGVIGGIILSLFFKFIAYVFLSVLLLYFILAILSAIQQAFRYKKPKHILLLPFCFFLYHFIYGFGALIGFIKLIFRISPVQKIKEPWKGAGYYRVKNYLLQKYGL